MKYVFIRDHRGAFPVDLMCRSLEMGSSGFYAWLKRSESPRRRDNLRLLTEIKAVHRRSRKTYGSPRIYAELNETGHACSRCRVARLMREHGIVSKHKKKFRVTTNSVHSFPIAENLLQRRFKVSRPSQCWVSDITYIPNLEGWLYLAVALGLFHRKVIGCSMQSRMRIDLVLSALLMAVWRRKPKLKLVAHSD